jgi:hypothetical protein
MLNQNKNKTTMTTQIEKIKKTIEPLRQEIINHKVYSAIKDVDDLKVFMQFHVYAVWDFMSLLKTLQSNLTCTSVPWFPKGTADTRFLINEIVVGEESDIDLNGIRKSHFELYLDAMKQCGADTSKIEVFTEVLKNTGDFDSAYLASETPKEAKDFVDFTFKVIESSKDYLQSAIFTFGREDLIPSMFMKILDKIYADAPDKVSIFKYYIERHIEVDGDHHSHLALDMVNRLCGTDASKWEQATVASIKALELRIGLWNAI